MASVNDPGRMDAFGLTEELPIILTGNTLTPGTNVPLAIGGKVFIPLTGANEESSIWR